MKATDKIDAARIDLLLGEGWQPDDDDGQCGVLWPEAFYQRSEIGKDAVVESHLQRDGEFGLAGALERERENPDHGAASWSIAINSSPAEPSPWRSRPCSPASA